MSRCLGGLPFIHPFTSRSTSSLLPLFGDYERSCCKPPCAGFELGFQPSEVASCGHPCVCVLPLIYEGQTLKKKNHPFSCVWMDGEVRVYLSLLFGVSLHCLRHGIVKGANDDTLCLINHF